MLAETRGVEYRLPGASLRYACVHKPLIRILAGDALFMLHIVLKLPVGSGLRQNFCGLLRDGADCVGPRDEATGGAASHPQS